jgi:hypothetical protein
MEHKEEKKVSQIWKEFEEAKSYQNNILLPATIRENIVAYEGQTWGNVFSLEATKDRPRVDTNWVKMIVDNKVSNVLSGKPVIKFTAREKANESVADIFNKFTEVKWKDIRGDSVVEEMVDEAAKKGTGIVYFYWDNEALGVQGRYRGGFKAKNIDVRNFFVSNPAITDVQDQQWIMFHERLDKKAVEKLAEKKYRSLIKADNPVEDIDKEQEGQELVTVLTKFFRINGEVHYQRATKTTVLHAPKAVNPNYMEAQQMPDSESVAFEDGEEKELFRRAFNLYPVALFQWNKRDNSIYGISEAEAEVKNQRVYNKIRSYEAEALEANSIGKLVEKDDAAPKGQKITNNPRQVLKDKSKTAAQGYYYLQGQPFSPALSTYADKLVEDMRVATGSTEIITGEIGKGLSAVAYAQLQAMADKPLKRKRKKLFTAIQSIGKIFECFFKIFYNESEGAFYENEGKEEAFIGTQYQDIDLGVDVVVGESGEYSELGEMTLASELYAKGELTVLEYLEVLPQTVFPNKVKISDLIQNRKNNEYEVLLAQTQELLAQNKKLQEVVNNIVPTLKENEQYKTMFAQLQNEYSNYIKMAAQTMQLKDKELAETRGQLDALMSGYLYPQNTPAQADANTPPVKGETK